MATINHDFNRIQINETIDKKPDGKVIRKSLMINIRADSVQEADKLYKDLKKVFNGNMTANNDKKKNKEEQLCEKCGAPMVLRRGKNGPFLGCITYPGCNFTKQIPCRSFFIFLLLIFKKKNLFLRLHYCLFNAFSFLTASISSFETFNSLYPCDFKTAFSTIFIFLGDKHGSDVIFLGKTFC